MNLEQHKLVTALAQAMSVHRVSSTVEVKVGQDNVTLEKRGDYADVRIKVSS